MSWDSDICEPIKKLLSCSNNPELMCIPRDSCDNCESCESCENCENCKPCDVWNVYDTTTTASCIEPSSIDKWCLDVCHDIL